APGDMVAYRFEIFGENLNRKTGLPSLSTKVSLSAAEPWTPKPSGTGEPLRSTIGERQLVVGQIGLPRDAAPGEYVLRLDARDNLADPEVLHSDLPTGPTTDPGYLVVASQAMDLWVR
ncbi:MAG TPA: hypothetical protein VMU19_10720, partial [Bryobacteraceae bacterium]|nr:hypothetical protein [Bryobacteraceae bacterium]